MKTSIKLSQQDKYSVWLLGDDMSPSMTDFVYDVYKQQFSESGYWTGNEYQDLAKGDQETREHSLVYCAFDLFGNPIATLKTIKRKPNYLLPVECDFEIDFIDICQKKGFLPNDMYEIGRLAKSGKAIKRAGLSRQEAVQVIELMIKQTILETSYHRHNVWVAAIDQIVLALLRSRGYNFESVGPTVDYLGSPTTPVMLPVFDWVQNGSGSATFRQSSADMQVADTANI